MRAGTLESQRFPLRTPSREILSTSSFNLFMMDFQWCRNSGMVLQEDGSFEPRSHV